MNALLVDQGRCDQSGWQAHIDGFDSQLLFGWAKRSDSLQPQFISLFIDDVCVQPYLPCAHLREDVRKAGIGNGHYGFAYHFDQPRYGKGIVEIREPETGAVLASCPYDFFLTLAEAELLALARRLTQEKQQQDALACYAALFQRFPAKPDALEAAAALALSLGQNELANSYFEKSAKITGSCASAWAGLPLQDMAKDPIAMLRLALQRYLRIRPEKLDKTALDAILNIFYHLLIAAPNPMLTTLYNNFVKYHILPKTASASERQFDINRDKIAFFASGLTMIKFIAPVIRKLSPAVCDIVLERQSPYDAKGLADCGLGDYVVRYTVEQLLNYKTIVFDTMYYDLTMDKLDLKGKTLINFEHGAEQMPYRCMQSHLCIVCSRNQIGNLPKLNARHLDAENFATLRSLPMDARTEFTYSGLFHFGDYLDQPALDKTALRAQLAQQLGRDLPEDKPLVFCIEDGYCSRAQLAYGLNKIADFCTVIVKPFRTYEAEYTKKLKNGIIVLADDAWAPNLPRFCADFILCGCCSGTFLSCIMAGLRPIPYYSRYARVHWSKSPWRPWRDFIGKPKNQLQRDCKNNLYARWDRFFDIIDPVPLKKAICEAEYSAWLKQNLGDFQKGIFGDWQLAGAAQKTAEHILRFACEGTLGRDAAAVYLREKG